MERPTYTEFKAAVIALVKANIGNEPWFRGVHYMELLEDYKSGLSVGEAASHAEILCRRGY